MSKLSGQMIESFLIKLKIIYILTIEFWCAVNCMWFEVLRMGFGRTI